MGLSKQGIKALGKLFQSMLDEGLHPGAQLAVYHEGQLAVELAGGLDDEAGNPVTAKTLFQIRSNTKILTTMVMLMLYDRGLFSFEDTVAKHWPEFAQNGKQGITIGQVMGHSAGIPDGPMIPARAMGDRAAVASAVEAMKPIWKPGTANGYHAATIGWIAQELVVRWEGRPLEQVLKTEILDPLGVSGIYLGLPKSEFPRMAKMVVEEGQRGRQGARARFSDFINTYEGARLPLAWVMGMATAHDMAYLMNILAFDGTFDGRTYISREALDKASEPSNPPGYIDLRLRHPVRWGLGFILGDTPDIYGTPPHPRAIGHAGGGASVVWADPEHRLAVAFLCNRMLGKASWDRSRRVGDAIYAALQ